jgi:hypothetical protein
LLEVCSCCFKTFLTVNTWEGRSGVTAVGIIKRLVFVFESASYLLLFICLPRLVLRQVFENLPSEKKAAITLLLKIIFTRSKDVQTLLIPMLIKSCSYTSFSLKRLCGVEEEHPIYSYLYNKLMCVRVCVFVCAW